MKKLSRILVTLFTLVIPVYLVVYLPDQVDWFDNKTDNMSPQQKIAHYTEIINEDPADDDAFLERGIAKLKLEDYHGAIDDLSTSIELNPESDWAYYYRCETWMALLDRKKAHADLLKALEINPDNEIAQSYREIVFKGK